MQKEVEEGLEQELNLALQMRNAYCKFSDGKYQETEPKKAAEILHKIGLIYGKRSTDKIALIQGVGLLNAAIFRNPSIVVEIKSDLSNLCEHILTQAEAKLPKADLLQKACQIKELILKLRKDVSQKLHKPSRTNFTRQEQDETSSRCVKKQSRKMLSRIQQMNNTIAADYKNIMGDLSQFCEEVMGKPPCKYAIVGMGSLARNEITPYSDFEHIILLGDCKNYESHLEYFRWYSVIFHAVILNLQETILPSLHIHSLNDKHSRLGDWYFDALTPRGISFDGMMPHACKFPLGRKPTTDKPFETELIKPVEKMLDYLSSEADMKNGYHLADILTKTCFVFGNEKIFHHFQNGVKKKHGSKPKQTRIEEVKQQVKKDLDNFSARFRLAKLHTFDSINIKQLVYRSSTLFISALARIHNISENSCFKMIGEMAKAKIITQSAKNKMIFAIEVACEMRLRVYEENNSQCDTMIQLKQNGQNIETFLSIVGAARTINYFQIAYCLQCEVAKQLNLTKLYFYSDPLLINFTIGLAFGMNVLDTNFTNKRLKILWNLSEFDFDACIEQLELSTYSCKSAAKDPKLLKSVAEHLYSTSVYDEAIEFYQRLLTEYRTKSVEENNDENIAWTYIQIGNCMNEFRQYEESLKNHKKALAIFRNITQNSKEDQNIAVALNNIGICLMDTHQYQEALIHLKQSLEIKKNTSPDVQKDRKIAATLNNIGLCLSDLRQYDDALFHLKQSHEIYESISLNKRRDSDIALTLNNLGFCLIDMHQNNNALLHLKESLHIKVNISRDKGKDGDVAGTLNNIGLCLRGMHRYDEALIRLEESLEIMKNKSLDERRDSDVARSLNNIGSCLLDIHQYDNALSHFKQSLEIYENVNQSFDKERDSDLAKTLNNIGLCLNDMHRYDDALMHFKQSLQIYKNISLDEQKDGNVAMALRNVAFCLKDCDHYNENETKFYFSRALTIYENLSADNQIAEIRAKMAQCSGKIRD